MGEHAVMAIDSGQTAIKVRLQGAESRTFPGLRANSPLVPQLAMVISKVAERADARSFTVLIGTCGLTRLNDDPVELLRLCAPHGVEEVVLAHDAVTSFLGAMGDRRGVVVAAGTGAITLGVGVEATARVDGWGNVIGDSGGGYWIGRAALDAVFRAHDGRGPATSLTALVHRRFPDLDSAYMELLTDVDQVRTVAGFAHDVASVASRDPVAAGICREAGRELAHSAGTAVERIGEADQENPVISLIGGIASAGVIRDSCIASLQERWPRFVPFPAGGDALDGAQALGQLKPSHPLSARVSRASLTDSGVTASAPRDSTLTSQTSQTA